ncbi:uncharacterized protein B0H18DRAFT_1122182 [Fomitopsis serialis]|uniref:uncharacterized protein n=1 Tax=Fomitopsis serialis TaxID=139415 RepID=UPI002007AD34|nr:uncharacterized protein B0H18DRAFT_1122182 [Neoantrodia serialis]KAH9920088.1 hypothetical protein B0H18DRAFT_1122182 [Neoantrodia serialis]
MAAGGALLGAALGPTLLSIVLQAVGSEIAMMSGAPDAVASLLKSALKSNAAGRTVTVPRFIKENIERTLRVRMKFLHRKVVKTEKTVHDPSPIGAASSTCQPNAQKRAELDGTIRSTPPIRIRSKL